MNTRVLDAGIIATGCAGLLVVGRLAVWPLASITLPPVADSVVAAPARTAARHMAADSVAAVVSRDPFRVTRRPALPAYDPLRLAEQLAPPALRPVLLLDGIIDGASPSGIVEGFPGVDGARVVRVGDVVGGMTIKKVGRGQVVITGMDTTWVLEVREPWKN